MKRLPAYVLPTAVAASLVLLTAMLGLLTLWELRMTLSSRMNGVRQARADAESAYTLYALHADDIPTEADFRLYDSLPQSQIRLRRELWGLYELVHVAAADSLVVSCRLYGIEPDARQTLYCKDNRTAVTLAGNTVLQGLLHLPRNGIVFGRVGADAYSGPAVAQPAIRHSDAALPAPAATAVELVNGLLRAAADMPAVNAADGLDVPFRSGETFRVRAIADNMENCRLRGRIVLAADCIRIDSTCRIENIIIVGRKIVVGHGARISAQLFARDTVVVEPCAELGYPSGIYAEHYAGLGEYSVVNGYAVVCGAASPDMPSPNYRQAATARLRGLLWVDGTAQVQGIVAGRAMLSHVAYFSRQGYYKDMLYNLAVLENPVTAQPLWVCDSGVRRKEAAWVE